MNNDTVELLQAALLDEAHAVLQYLLHSSRVLPDGDVPFNDVSDHLKEHADAEQGHYQRLYDHLRRNGVEPKFGNDELIHHGDGVNAVVKAHQEAERGAIDAYTKLLDVTETNGEVETNQLVQDLLNDEITHLDDFTRYSDLSVLKADQGEKKASIKFASVDEALQHLADVTGEQVKIASEKAEVHWEGGEKRFDDLEEATEFAKEQAKRTKKVMSVVSGTEFFRIRPDGSRLEDQNALGK